ncbi:MAG: carbohydrate ABC transporter substrate-binding protein, partial [Acetatifactor sp.]
EALAGFRNVELLSDSPALDGEEGLYDEINNESEVLTDYGASSVLEAALYGNRSLDDLMAEWNDRWAKAQTTLGVETKY